MSLIGKNAYMEYFWTENDLQGKPRKPYTGNLLRPCGIKLAKFHYKVIILAASMHTDLRAEWPPKVTEGIKLLTQLDKHFWILQSQRNVTNN